MNGSPVVAFQHRRRPASVLPWAVLIAQGVARAYLAFMLALATFALAPLIFGMSATVVHGVSMRPFIVTGDVVLSLPYDQNSPVPLGRVVVFPAPSGSGHTGLIIHRIVAIQADGLLITKGDGDADTDVSALNRADILSEGKVLIPWIGLPTIWLTDGDLLPFTLWVTATALAILLEAKGPGAGRAPPTRAILRRSAPVTAIILIVGLIVGSIAVSQAMFTSRTTSIGNTWNYPAANPPARLSFTTSPSNSTGGVAFSRQPVVTVLDAQGTRTTGTRTVTITLSAPGTATLSCTSTVVTTATGTLPFAGCAVNKPGTYTLRASSGTLVAATSATFVVTTGPAARLQFFASPSDGTTAGSLTPQPVVVIVDRGGNQVSSTAPVTLTATNPTGPSTTLACAANPQSSVAGRATFAGCRIGAAGTYTLTASSGSLSAATSSSFVLTAPVVPTLTCQSQIWIATFSWTPTPYVPTVYTLYVNGVKVRATGADGWNSYVQLTSDNVPASLFPAGTATVEVRRVTSTGAEEVIARGMVKLGAADYRTYLCG